VTLLPKKRACFKAVAFINYFSDCLYSVEIEELLKKKRITTGNRVRITKGKQAYEGLLMPRIGLGDKNSIVLKLDNGYNAGIRFEHGLNIKKIKGGRQIRFKSAKVRAFKDPNKPTVSILGCGGTIASRVEYTTGAVFPAFSPDDLLLSFPELKEITNIQGRKLFDLFSEDMTPAHWQIIAREVAKEIILMHGTDTLHYTAAALSFMVQNPTVPVVIVGAQRSSDRGSSDNAMNLASGALIGAKSDIAEVGVCMHANMSDDYCFFHQGTKVRKMHTSRRDTFRSINVLPFAKVWYGSREIELLRTDYKTLKTGRVVLDDKINPRVGLFYTYPGIEPEMIEGLGSFYDGVVIAGTGLGHVPTNPSNNKLAKNLIPALQVLIETGVPVVIAPQTIYGRMNLNVYEAGRLLNEIGVIGHGCDWTPETALVKLMWVLGHTKNLNKVREIMLKNVAGEISERTEAEAFLI
jgi:glutamyl-tRNA(Gln) amidotransferase subunit D